MRFLNTRTQSHKGTKSGLNDIVLLPIVLVAMVFLGEGAQEHATAWGRLALGLFLLGPGAGIVVGVLAMATLDLIRRRIGIRRDYEPLMRKGELEEAVPPQAPLPRL